MTRVKGTASVGAVTDRRRNVPGVPRCLAGRPGLSPEHALNAFTQRGAPSSADVDSSCRVTGRLS